MTGASPILTLNAGSATLKFALYGDAVAAAGTLDADWRGLVEHIGTEACVLTAVSMHGEHVRQPLGLREHAGAAIDDMLAFLQSRELVSRLAAVSHRVVHGGTRFSAPVRIDAPVLDALRALTRLAPLHQPHNIAGIEAATSAFPHAMQIACFDTAFHRTQPRVNDCFALPAEYYAAGVRRYGFHGLSYEYVRDRLSDISARLARGRVIIAHLGSGASMCAIHAGRAISSTMGLSALDGLPMGTRCGQIDPGVLLWLSQERRMSAEQISELLYHRSGLLGLSGISADMRELESSTAENAKHAIDYFVARVRRETGALAAALGGIDALVFTAGIGEHSARIRAEVINGLAWLGLELDPAANRDALGTTRLSSPTSPVQAWLVPTDEEAMLARHARRLLAGG